MEIDDFGVFHRLYFINEKLNNLFYDINRLKYVMTIQHVLVHFKS